MKNFRVKHSQCDSIIYIKTFLFRKLEVIIIKPLPRWQQDTLLLTGTGIYSQVYHRTPCSAVRIFKGVVIKINIKVLGTYFLSSISADVLFG